MVYVYPWYAPMADRQSTRSVWFVWSLQEDTHQERDLLPRDGLWGAQLRRESGVLASNWGKGCAADLDGRKARC